MSIDYPIPSAVLELRALEERWGQVVDWVYDAATAAVRARTKGYELSMRIADLTKRAKACTILDKKYHQRLRDIDAVDEAFKEAYYLTRSSLNFEEIATYAAIVEPIVRQQYLEEQQRMGPAWKRLIEKKEEETRAREERKAERKKKRLGRMSDETDGRSRNLLKTNRATSVINEGTRDRSIPEDGGISNAPRRESGGSLSAGEISGSTDDDRSQSQVGCVDCEGATE